MPRKQYVTYGIFGRRFAEYLGERVTAFPTLRVRKILWWADDVGRNGIDSAMIEGEQRIALNRENFRAFQRLLPDWTKEARRRQTKEPMQFENPICPQLEERAQPASRTYVRNYYR